MEERLIVPPERTPSPAVHALAERVAGKHSADRPFIVREAGLIFGLSTMGIFQIFGSPWVANLERSLALSHTLTHSLTRARARARTVR